MGFWDKYRSELELEAERQQLKKILVLPDDSRRIEELRKLAREVGASTIRLHPGHGEAGLSELAQNIHFALQTKAMIAAIRTSSNYVIVTVILAAIAFSVRSQPSSHFYAKLGTSS